MTVKMKYIGIFVCLFFLVCCESATPPYYVGVGRTDITGPAAEVNMMGYANPSQTTHGVHFRLYSRAFIIADAEKKNRIAIVNLDICMGTQAIKIEVVNRLKTLYNGLYTNDNVILTGIHTHSGPAGYFQYVLFEITSLGFVNETFQAVVNGVVESISLAHKNLQPGYLHIGEGTLQNASINRSPVAYLRNPAEERARYKNDTDKEMVVLKMTDKDGKDIGMLNWFAVHCTSMNNTNTLISGDNKGYASMMMEKYISGETIPGRSNFVAAFAQSNEGDVSPNTKGPHCINTRKPCDFVTSTCDGKNELCIAFGPGKDMFDSTQIIGEKQFQKSLEIYKNATTALEGPVDFRHTFVDMTNVNVTTVNGTKAHTCLPAMGESFAAGTIDGPGAFNFHQADTKGNFFWNLVRDVLHTPSEAQIKCHHPKPILLDTGEMDWPYPWHPKIIPLQVARIGQLVIIAVPGEFSTMSGRRLRESVYKVITEAGFPKNAKVVIAGLSNTYTHYITTFEEYQEQRYEGASTIFGPHTLTAYIQEFDKLALAMTKGSSVPTGPSPPNYLPKQLEFLPGVRHDSAPSFGGVTEDVQPEYKRGETASATFWAGNPRNMMKNSTFLTVERSAFSGSWNVICTDACWETRFHWERKGFVEDILSESKATVEWIIPSTASSGNYRLRHFGYYKEAFTGTLKPYSGTSSIFIIN